MTQATATLAKFTSAVRLGDVPVPVVKRAKDSLVNIFACAVAGAREPVLDRAANALHGYSCPGHVTCIGRAAITDPISAAFLNCLASAVLAFDETHARTVLHPVGPVASAALAFAEEQHLSGEELLVSLIVGVEVASRASLAISTSPARVAIGWSQSGVCGGIGAAAAVARLMGLDARGTSDAIGLAANSSAGMRAMNGTMAVSIAVANAAANGYRAALLAAAGVAGSATALEDPYGFVALYAPEGHVPYLTERLGDNYALMELNFKPYPCGVVAHAAIDAARQIRMNSDFAAEDVQEVTVTLHSSCLLLGDRALVRTNSEASVSIQYWVATGLLSVNLGPECLRQEWIDNRQRQRLHQLVRLAVDDDLSQMAARMSVRLRSGRELRAEIANGLGSGANPMNAEDLESKFADSAAPRFETERIREIISACRSFEQIEDVGSFMQLLRASA